MENNEKKLMDSENLETTENREVDELEFVSSEDDVKDYPALEIDEVKIMEAAVEAEPQNIINDDDEEEVESDDDDATVSPRYLVKLVLVLTVICTGIALLLAVVNSITKDKIADNIAKQQEAAIFAIFQNGDATQEYVIADAETVYIVFKDGSPIGYCVNSCGTGFGGEVQVMVGLRADGSVHGIKIVSMSETPGIGTKVYGESFLKQFIGKSDTSNVDMISGATFSSRAIIEAVEYALLIDFDMNEYNAG